MSRTGFADGRLLAESPAAGRLVDTLRRCLSLPTDPPPTGTGPWLAVLWLGQVIADARDRNTPLGWSEAVALHPAMQVLAEAGGPVGAEHFGAIVEMATRAWTWEQLRRHAVDASWLCEFVPADLARWMDEGMFAR